MSPDSSPSTGIRADARIDAAPDGADGLADLVEAVRRYRNAEGSMRGRSRGSMHLGRTDMTALRLMLRAGQTGSPLSAAALARQLEISTAATTVLIDRLERGGHAERRRSATDKRAIEIWPTVSSDEEVRSTMGVLHERMMAIAGALGPEDCTVIHAFLGRLGHAMTGMSGHDLPAVPPAPQDA